MSARVRYAEVIGDPIGHSKSPVIHRFWIERLKLDGDYRRTLVRRGALADFFAERRLDPDWRGCNVTIPHKESAANLVDQLDLRVAAIGAVNCVVPRDGGLLGANTDIDGLGAALDSTALEGAKAVVIGGGGGARAAIAYLAGRSARELVVLVRDPAKAEPLRALAPAIPLVIAPLRFAGEFLGESAAIINATQMGMSGCPEMPGELIAEVARHARDVTLLDMVYEPIETRFLATGREAGGRVVDGLTMLIGQAARAFELLYGEQAPAADEHLRRMLVTNGSGLADLGYNSASTH